ncbi:hypothetical protein AWZ03_013535 [Drosophila navojoa]|uniref:Uncharacterized protein n=1 Tax=Drosophila navojoa TaxID=7232 RepID=A0A484AUJ1_DRONA|nr:hypothetical protein AWZ03_013535 [Drosophila navojoa]
MRKARIALWSELALMMHAALECNDIAAMLFAMLTEDVTVAHQLKLELKSKLQLELELESESESELELYLWLWLWL